MLILIRGSKNDPIIDIIRNKFFGEYLILDFLYEIIKIKIISLK